LVNWLDNGFLFGDRATWDFPILKVEEYPQIKSPVRRVESYTIPGRSGEVHIFEDAFDNIPKTYKCYFHAEKMVSQTSDEIKRWLLANQGYRRLMDAYDWEHYHRATVLEEITFENWMDKYARFTVNFSCDPRSFLVSGDQPIILEKNGEVMENGFAFPAKPTITVYGSGKGTLKVGPREVKLLEIGGEITLDCEEMEAYKMTGGVAENKNMQVSAPEFLELFPGENPVSWTGGVERVEIIPRWYTI